MYTSRGIIMASIEELRRDFTRLVGYRDAATDHANLEDVSAPKGGSRAED